MKKIWGIILLALVLAACRKENSQLTPPPNPPPGDGSSVNVTVNQNQPGYTIPATFEGLSFEIGVLTTNPEFLNVNNTILVQLIKNLGPGILRIGGGTSDEISWLGNKSTGNNTAVSLTAADIDRLSAFSKIAGWKVLFGLNLANNDVAAATDEAQYVQNSLGDNLYAFESGNEPNYFQTNFNLPSYDYPTYQNGWETYLSTIKNKIPQASFGGPGVVKSTDWVSAFAERENKNIKLLDEHYYVTGPATDPSINYHMILAANNPLTDALQTIKNESAKYNLPYRITEINSVWGGGKKGVSDVFASSLWELDAMWTLAENNGAGINFHDGYGLCYSPIAIQNGVVTASPGYYAMLAFEYGSKGGTIIPSSVSNPALCSAYACVKADNTYSLTLINRDETKNYSFNIKLSKTASTIKVARLTAPSITSTTGVTFAGGMVNTDGSFAIKTSEEYAVSGKSFVVNVPAGSAAVVTVQ